jgi:hypothetical protein
MADCPFATQHAKEGSMIFWTTWMFGLIAGAVCLLVALDPPRPSTRFVWLAGSYFSMASGVIGSLLAVPL